MLKLVCVLLSRAIIFGIVPSYLAGQRSDTTHALFDASLRPGDVLKVNVWENPKLSGEFEVALDGTLKHPLYNEIKVVGVPLAAVKERLANFLTQFQREPRLEIEPLLKVTVSGEVRSPSVYSVSPETTIGDAIAKAGGATESGRLDQVTIVRGKQHGLVDLTKRDVRVGDMAIHSGDKLIVGRRHSFVRDFVAPYASLISSVASIILLATR